jgi:hypothetical protein
VKQKTSENNLNGNQQLAMSNVKLDDVLAFKNELEQKKNNSILDLENYILLGILTKYPIRNDLQKILISYKPLNDDENYVLIPPNNDSVKIYLNEYKTSGKHGSVILDIEPSLGDDIRRLISLDGNRKYLFQTKDGNPYSDSGFTYRLQKLFEDRFGVKIGTTILRKIYLTGKYGNTFNEFAQDNHIMGHNASTAQSNYISNQPQQQQQQPMMMMPQQQQPMMMMPVMMMPQQQPMMAPSLPLRVEGNKMIQDNDISSDENENRRIPVTEQNMGKHKAIKTKGGIVLHELKNGKHVLVARTLKKK